MTVEVVFGFRILIPVPFLPYYLRAAVRLIASLSFELFLRETEGTGNLSNSDLVIGSSSTPLAFKIKSYEVAALPVFEF